VATAAEKEAKQAARDANVAAITQGQRRLATEQPKAAGAFPVRRLRSSGDLSRYAIGGFADDPLAPIPPAAPPPKKGAAPRKPAPKRMMPPKKYGPVGEGATRAPRQTFRVPQTSPSLGAYRR
jgi:hypothetical protein